MKRFWNKVNKSGSCWLWTGACPQRYGVFGFMKKNILAHRMSWILTYGEVPDGMKVLHKCDNTKCVNPEHLWLGTQKDNIQDMINKKRGLVGEKNGSSKLSDKETEEIKIKYKAGTKAKILAGEYGVCRQNIERIGKF